MPQDRGSELNYINPETQVNIFVDEHTTNVDRSFHCARSENRTQLQTMLFIYN